jgi:hypothetical protein
VQIKANRASSDGDTPAVLSNQHYSTEAPHLHYEVLKDKKVVNPLNFYYGNISAVEYVVIAQLANQENQSLD